LVFSGEYGRKRLTTHRITLPSADAVVNICITIRACGSADVALGADRHELSPFGVSRSASYYDVDRQQRFAVAKTNRQRTH